MNKRLNLIFLFFSRGLRKRGISEMVAYIILVGIAIGISSFVFVWMTHYLPGGTNGVETKSCPEGSTVLIKSSYCSAEDTELEIVLKNNGRFSLDGFKVWVNDKRDAGIGAYEINDSGVPLAPKTETVFYYDYHENVEGSKIPYFESSLTLIEVTPFVVAEDGTLKYCQKITESLECNLINEICFNGDDDDRDGDIDCEDSDCWLNYYCSAQDEHLFLHYSFDSPGHPDDDHSQTAETASVPSGSSPPSLVEGLIGDAYSFSGSNNQLSLMSSVEMDEIGGTFSISILINPSSASPQKSNAHFISRGQSDYWSIRLDQSSAPNNDLYIYPDTDVAHELSISGAVEPDIWSLIVGVWDSESNKFDIYINGDHGGSADYDYLSNSGSFVNVTIGCESGGSASTCYNGHIDEVRIYDKVLDEEYIKMMYDYYFS